MLESRDSFPLTENRRLVFLYSTLEMYISCAG
jgi:hypothetical protein